MMKCAAKGGKLTVVLPGKPYQPIQRVLLFCGPSPPELPLLRPILLLNSNVVGLRESAGAHAHPSIPFSHIWLDAFDLLGAHIEVSSLDLSAIDLSGSRETKRREKGRNKRTKKTGLTLPVEQYSTSHGPASSPSSISRLLSQSSKTVLLFAWATVDSAVLHNAISITIYTYLFQLVFVYFMSSETHHVDHHEFWKAISFQQVQVAHKFL